MYNIIKKSKAITAVAALILTATAGYSAFKIENQESLEKVIKNTKNDLHWYVRDSNGQYSEFTPSTGLESVDDICPTSGPQICALGFESEMNPTELTDLDITNSADQRYKPAD